jgi:hypothetical protein
MLFRRNVAVSQHPCTGETLLRKRQKTTQDISPVSVAHGDYFSVPEYTVAEFKKLTQPRQHMVDDLSAPAGVNRQTVWITDGPHYYALQTEIRTSKTDTENRGKLPAESLYIHLQEYQDIGNIHIATVRVADKDRPELVAVNAGNSTSGEKVLSLVQDLIQGPFKLQGYTLHDAAHCHHKQSQFSIRKLRLLAGLPQSSIYERVGFRPIACYRQSVGQYTEHTQIPQLTILAEKHIQKQRLDMILHFFVPLIKVPIFGEKIVRQVDSAIRRWCPVPETETIAALFQKLLVASKHFKHSEAPLSLNGNLVSKSLFYSELNLLQNVLMSEVYTDEDATYIRTHLKPFADHPGSGRWAFILQCAIDCVGSHILYEKANTPDYAPLSHPVNTRALAEAPTFAHAVVQLTDNLPLTWTELCRSERVAALFEGALCV